MQAEKLSIINYLEIKKQDQIMPEGNWETGSSLEEGKPRGLASHRMEGLVDVCGDTENRGSQEV